MRCEIDEKRETIKAPARVHIRWMIRRDMPEVLDIESAVFDYPWSEDEFLRCLRQRNIIGMVAEQGEDVVGFMVYELHRTRIHLLDLAISPQRSRRTIGTQLINKLKGKLEHQRRTGISIITRESNVAGAMFFASQGFRAILAPGHWQDSGEDGYSFGYRMPEPIVEKFRNPYA